MTQVSEIGDIWELCYKRRGRVDLPIRVEIVANDGEFIYTRTLGKVQADAALVVTYGNRIPYDDRWRPDTLDWLYEHKREYNTPLWRLLNGY